jgi:hypothetical protein
MPSIHLDVIAPTTLAQVTGGMQPRVNRVDRNPFVPWLGRHYLTLSQSCQPLRLVEGSRCLTDGLVALIIGPFPLEPNSNSWAGCLRPFVNGLHTVSLDGGLPHAVQGKRYCTTS